MSKKQVKADKINQLTPNFSTKFTLYNFVGQEKAYYLVDRKPLGKPTKDLLKNSVAHSIIIIDRSGSMYRDLEPLKETLIKLFTLDEYNNYHLVVSLISYSSVGDVTCHFERIPIQEVMKTNSQYIKEVKRIQVTGATCISQSMKMAASIIKEGELTAINLHSDGYANDPSSRSEVSSIEKICEQLKEKEVFINTIAYSSADFKFLSKIANTVSGSCVQTNSVKEIYDAIYSSSKVLGESATTPIEETLIKDYDYQVFVSKTAKKINGSASTLKIVGLKADDEGVFYKYKKITKEEYDNLNNVPAAQTDESVFSFAKANLADGNLNTAKYTLVSSFDATLTKQHAKALTNAEIVELSKDLEAVIFTPEVLQNHQIVDQVKVNDKISLLQLVRILEENANSIIINLKELQQKYQRQGLKRIPGTRDKDGNFTEPWLKTEYLDGGDYVRIDSFEVNRNTATINMLIPRLVKLVKADDETAITNVAGLLLTDLKAYNNYTIVSDGEVNVKSLQVKISSKPVFELLKANGVIKKDGAPAEEFDFRGEYEIELEGLPIVPFDGRFDSIDGVFEELALNRVLSSIISAHLKEESETFLPEQLEELKKHYLSKSLYINFPTTTEYADLKEAIALGTVDSRVSYKVDIGSKQILNLGKLYSANKFLDRLYEVYNQATGEKIDKPTFDITLDGNFSFRHKTLSARTKLTKVDDLMRLIFDDFLGIESNGKVAAILSKVDADSLVRILSDKWNGETIKKDEFITALTDAKNKLDEYSEKVYRSKISPLVFYIGSTGLVPEDMEAKAETAEEIAAKYIDLQFSSSEQEGIFFEVGDSIISVYAKNEYYTI